MDQVVIRPRPEPEVEDRQLWPVPGSRVWFQRYAVTANLLEEIINECPSATERVQLAMIELSAAVREDIASQQVAPMPSHG